MRLSALGRRRLRRLWFTSGLALAQLLPLPARRQGSSLGASRLLLLLLLQDKGSGQVRRRCPASLMQRRQGRGSASSACQQGAVLMLPLHQQGEAPAVALDAALLPLRKLRPALQQG